MWPALCCRSSSRSVRLVWFTSHWRDADSPQIGGAAVFSIQAGLLTIYPQSYSNFHNIQASWWFFAGWYFSNAILVAVLFRDPKKGKLGTGETTATDGEAGTARETDPVEEKEKGDSLGLVRARTRDANRRVGRPEMTRVQSLV